MIKRYFKNHKAIRSLIESPDTRLEIVAATHYNTMAYKLTLIFNGEVAVSFFSYDLLDFLPPGVYPFHPDAVFYQTVFYFEVIEAGVSYKKHRKKPFKTQSILITY